MQARARPVPRLLALIAHSWVLPKASPAMISAPAPPPPAAAVRRPGLGHGCRRRWHRQVCGALRQTARGAARVAAAGHPTTNERESLPCINNHRKSTVLVWWGNVRRGRRARLALALAFAFAVACVCAHVFVSYFCADAVPAHAHATPYHAMVVPALPVAGARARERVCVVLGR